MVAIGTQNSRTVLDDDKTVFSYADALGTDVEIEIMESRFCEIYSNLIM